jgi:hypothetical protein
MEGRERGDVHDPPPAPHHHAAQHRPAAAEKATQVGVEHGVPVFVRGQGEQRLAAQAGVVDQSLDRPERFFDLGGDIVRPGGVAQVEAEGTGAGRLLHGTRRRLVGVPGEGHPVLGHIGIGGIGGQRLDDRPPQPPAAAGYENRAHRSISSRARVTAPAIRRLSSNGR